MSTQEYTLNCSATHMTHCAWPRNMGLPLSRALFSGAGEDRDVGVNTYFPGFTLSSGVKCGANANLFLCVSPSVFTKLQCASCSVGSIAFCTRGALPRAMSHTHATKDTSLWIRDSDRRVHAHLPVRLPSISADKLAIAACTHVYPTERASMIKSHNYDCYPGFQENKRAGRALTFRKITRRQWKRAGRALSFRMKFRRQ